MASLVVRPATASDAAHIAQIQVEGWRAAYKDFIPSWHLEKLSIDDKTWFWSSILGDQEYNNDILVVELPRKSSSDVVGFISYGSAVEDGNKVWRGELRALYVSPAEWSHGAGRRLCEAALSRIAEVTSQPVVVDVEAYTQNPQALKFYQRLGFEKTGESTTEVAGAIIHTTRLSRTIVREVQDAP